MAPRWVVTSIKFVFFCGLHICVVWLQFALLACLNCVWRSLLAHLEPQLPWVLNESQLGGMAVNVQLLTSNSLVLPPLGFRNLCSGSSFLLSHLKTFCSEWDNSIVTIRTPKYQHLIENFCTILDWTFVCNTWLKMFVQYLIENVCAILDWKFVCNTWLKILYNTWLKILYNTWLNIFVQYLIEHFWTTLDWKFCTILDWKFVCNTWLKMFVQ